jgi:hypothetical protein
MSQLVIISLILMATAITMGGFAFLLQAMFSALLAITLAVSSVTLAVLSLRE